MFPEFDFPTCEVAEAAAHFLAEGCVLLRRFCDIDALSRLGRVIRAIHEEIRQVHVFPAHLRERGLAMPSQYLFGDRHRALLRAVFGPFDFADMDNGVSRHVDPLAVEGSGWQGPLPPHLDAFVHSPSFTVNFWVPLQSCGADMPRLGVVRAPFHEVLRFTGFSDVLQWHDADDPRWRFGHFRPEMKAMWDGNPAAAAELRAWFARGLWCPVYDFGDAMMLSNWTLHFTQLGEGEPRPRENLELRVIGTASLSEILDAARNRLPGAN
jgi:hypothetical protein